MSIYDARYFSISTPFQYLISVTEITIFILSRRHRYIEKRDMRERSIFVCLYIYRSILQYLKSYCMID